MKANGAAAWVRARQIVPVALLAVFATALAGAVAFVHLAKTRATQDYLAAQADIERVQNDVIDKYTWGEFDQKKTEALMKELDRRREDAEEKREAALEAAYSRQSYITYTGVIMFLVLCAATAFLARKAALNPPA
jgi:hypothetical protein